MKDEVVKIPKIKYLYSVIASIFYIIVFAVFADKLDMSSSYLPFILMAVYDIVNILLVKKASPRECFKLFMTSVLTVFVLYKIISIFGIVNTYRDDGFFSNTESNFYFIFDIMMLINMISTFMFLAFLRFMMTRKSVKSISKTSVRRFAAGVTILGVIAIADLLLWNLAEPYENKFFEYVSTYSYEKWEKYPDKRINMLPDFEKKYDLDGMKREDVEKLIGTPESPDGYELGYSQNGKNYLIITYKDDVVEEYKVIQIQQQQTKTK